MQQCLHAHTQSLLPMDEHTQNLVTDILIAISRKLWQQKKVTLYHMRNKLYLDVPAIMLSLYRNDHHGFSNGSIDTWYLLPQLVFIHGTCWQKVPQIMPVIEWCHSGKVGSYHETLRESSVETKEYIMHAGYWDINYIGTAWTENEAN